MFDLLQFCKRVLDFYFVYLYLYCSYFVFWFLIMLFYYSCGLRNKLPSVVLEVNSLAAFRRQLKTHLFTVAYTDS